MANAWMNTPAGFQLTSQGRLVSVDPLAAALNPSTFTEDPHMLVSAYVVTGFLVAAVYAAGILRGRADQHHRRGLALGMAMAAPAIALAGITGDASARFVYQAQPIKFAAMEGLYQTQRAAPLHLGGIPVDSQHRVLFAIKVPYGLSLLAALDPNAQVRGLDSYSDDARPNTVVVHLAFDTMAGLGTLLGSSSPGRGGCRSSAGSYGCWSPPARRRWSPWRPAGSSPSSAASPGSSTA